MNKDPKASINAVCATIEKDHRDRWVTTYPAVDCGYDCKHCGWNPFEAKRRMSTGIVLERDGRKSIHFVRA